jgi:hypothetical protein
MGADEFCQSLHGFSVVSAESDGAVIQRRTCPAAIELFFSARILRWDRFCPENMPHWNSYYTRFGRIRTGL